MINVGLALVDEIIEIQSATLLEIESVMAYAKTVEQFYHYHDGGQLKLADKNMKPLKESEVMIVSDILGYDVNSAAIIKLIYSDIEEQLNEKPEVKSMIENLTDTITELVSYELIENELDLEYDEITIQELIKAVGVQIETRSDSLLDKIIEILQVYKYLSKKKLLVFVNVVVYFTGKELEKIIEYIQLYHLDVLFLERNAIEMEWPGSYIVDEDLFVIRK